MPISPTYPGVYIEEIPSGVRTITGVSTSITAFVGYTPRGDVNRAVHIFSFADFERSFGGLSIDSELSYAVRQFFANGGGEAYVVRTAKGASEAAVTLRALDNTDVLVATAAGAGVWGQDLHLTIDHDTVDPRELFNLYVVVTREQDGRRVVTRTEDHRNLSMNADDPAYAVEVVKASSDLVRLTAVTGLAYGTGSSRSGTLTDPAVSGIGPGKDSLTVHVDGKGPYTFTLTAPAGADLAAKLVVLKDVILTAVNSRAGAGSVTGASTGTTVTISSKAGAGSSVRMSGTAAAQLRFGPDNGGTESSAAALVRPAPTGTIGGAARSNLPNTGSIGLTVQRADDQNFSQTVTLPLWTDATTKPADLAGAATLLQKAIRDQPDELLDGATVVATAGGALRVTAGPGAPQILLTFADVGGAPDPAATALGLKTATVNVAGYSAANTDNLGYQSDATAGNDGTRAAAGDVIGTEAAKSGVYALENVDLFNLLVLPDLTKSADMTAVVPEALKYCERRRAFLILDAPDTLDSFAAAEAWAGQSLGTIGSRNGAIYFPRLRAPDPLRKNAVRPVGAAGAIAGLFARTDAERGVWKAPAGTAATLVGATGLTVPLTDLENGKLNPLGFNCLRVFPVVGPVTWGARTLKGADVLADDYKYIPVRRLVLYLEESLYRGTQWAVFEPNDEPLWAQIRLNLGAFMHTLFAQGAFKGRTPREAYFVKCDKDTTTQNDINLGRVNIVVGFAPLKPAEFVVIQIQQIAGAIQT